MRRISKKEIVRQHKSSKIHDKIVQPFRDIKEGRVNLKTFSEVRRFHEEVISPLQIEGLALIGCHASGDFIENNHAIIDALEEITEGDVECFMSITEKDKAPGAMEEQALQRMKSIARHFARQHKCHNTAKFWICYCDERRQ